MSFHSHFFNHQTFQTAAFSILSALVLSHSPSLHAEDDSLELITNGNMELTGGWDGSNCGGPTKPELVEIGGDEKHGEEYSLHIVIERMEAGEYPMVTSAPFATEQDNFYNISFWYKIVEGSFAVMIRNGADNNYVTISKDPLSAVGDWEHFEGEYIEEAGGTNARLCITSAQDGICEMYLDDVSIQPASP